MLPKFAESGTGGIPRRAFNDPRALESLGSSNLSTNFGERVQQFGDTTTRVGGLEIYQTEMRREPYVSLNGKPLTPVARKGFVAGKDGVRSVIREMDKDIREIEKQLPKLAGKVQPQSFEYLASELATLKTERAGLQAQVRSGGYLNSRALNARANPNENYRVPAEYAKRVGVNTTNSF